MPRKTRGGDGSFSRRAALLMIGGGGLMAVSGTGSFSQVDADRGFSAETASDESALLGIKTFDVNFYNTNNDEKILELKNRTGSTVNITFTEPGFLEIEQVGDLRSGVWRDVEAKATKERSGSGPVKITITAESDTTSITATRTIEVDTDIGTVCRGPRETFSSQSDAITIEKTVEIEPGAVIKGKVTSGNCVILGEGAEVKS